MIVYKYVIPARIDVLTEGRIRFTQPRALNDPFEMLPSVASVVATYPSKESVNDFRELMEWSYNDSFVFLSLTEKPDNLLMWSHYADCHRGFVIGFDEENSFFQGKIKSVQYSNHRPEIPNETLYDMTPILYTKSEDWAYEKELRMFARPSEANREPSDPDDLHMFKLPPECIREIIYGWRLLPENRTKISDAAKLYPNVEFFEAVPDETDFKMQIVPCNATLEG